MHIVVSDEKGEYGASGTRLSRTRAAVSVYVRPPPHRRVCSYERKLSYTCSVHRAQVFASRRFPENSPLVRPDRKNSIGFYDSVVDRARLQISRGRAGSIVFHIFLPYGVAQKRCRNVALNRTHFVFRHARRHAGQTGLGLCAGRRFRRSLRFR